MFPVYIREHSVPGIQISGTSFPPNRDVPDVQTEHCATLSPKTQCENCITGKTIIDLARSRPAPRFSGTDPITLRAPDASTRPCNVFCHVNTQSFEFRLDVQTA